MIQIDIIAIVFAIVSIRYFVSLWGYSGQSKPNMFGDFEAQRHWMEITINLPIGDWYRHTAFNDLMYWGLDYPPLTAYFSWIFGKLANLIHPDLVILSASRGHESIYGKLFMRLSVIFCDLIIFFPSILYSYKFLFMKVYKELHKYPFLVHLLMITSLLSPSLLLIDHGHFQYNSVCIGFALAGSSAILYDYDILGSVLFSLSLNFKQMSLYYALIFFCVLLRKCLIQPTLLKKFEKLIGVGLSVIITFGILWSPFCFFRDVENETCISSMLHVLVRLFPFSRGIFEDKVANFWYTLSIVFDFRTSIDSSVLSKLSVLLTLLLLSPTLAYLLRFSLTAYSMYIGLVNSALCFFLASFQVHEKSLLLSLVPATMLLPIDPLLFCWYQILGTFSMYPLLIKDGLRIPYVVCISLYLGTVLIYSEESTDVLRKNTYIYARDEANMVNVIKTSNLTQKDKDHWTLKVFNKLRVIYVICSAAGCIILHLAEIFVPVPTRYPDLYPALFSIYSFLNLVVYYLITVIYLYYPGKFIN